MENNGFFKTPNKLFSDGHAARMGSAAYIVYSALCSHANTDKLCFPSYACLQREAGTAKATTAKALTKLIELGYIEKSTQKGQVNFYKILPLPVFTCSKTEQPPVQKLNNHLFRNDTTPSSKTEQPPVQKLNTNKTNRTIPIEQNSFNKEQPWEKTVNAKARPPIGDAEIIAYFGSLPSDRVGVESSKPENQIAVTEKIVINQTDLIGATEKKELEFRRAESVTRTANPARTKQTINQQVKELINKICSWDEFYTKRKAYLESCDFYKKSGIQAVEGTILKPYRELIENRSKAWHSEEDRFMAIAEATELIKQHVTELGINANSNAQQPQQSALTKKLEELIELHKNNPQQAANLAKGNPMIWNKFIKHINKETTHV